MRACLALIMIVACGLPAYAQPKDQKAPTSKTIYANLQTEINGAPFRESLKLDELFEALNRELPQGHKVSIDLDWKAFTEELYQLQQQQGGNETFDDIHEWKFFIHNLSAKTSALNVLRQTLKRFPIQSALVVRAGKVEIVPSAPTKEYMLNQTVQVDFKDRPLEAALEELSELTGVSIVIDSRTKEKAKTAVSAAFRDDVALQDAVRMLSEMAELKIVYLVTGIYITTPEHAQVMLKELKQIYEVPIAPPLPPRRWRLKEAA